MVKVITYGTYDLLHYGHRRLLEWAKSLGDYLEEYCQVVRHTKLEEVEIRN